MTELKKRLDTLNEYATSGHWCQFGLCSGPYQAEAREAHARGEYHKIDTSHNVSAVKDGDPYRVATFHHANDAAFAEALVNAYRAGELVTQAHAEALVAAAYDDAAKYHDDILEHDRGGIEYSSLVGIPISNLSELEASCQKAALDSYAIRGRTPESAKSNLDSIIAYTDTLGYRRGLDDAIKFIDGEYEFYGEAEGRLDGIPFETVAHVCAIMAKRLRELEGDNHV